LKACTDTPATAVALQLEHSRERGEIEPQPGSAASEQARALQKRDMTPKLRLPLTATVVAIAIMDARVPAKGGLNTTDLE
jgi:hypothetical protein